MKKAANGDISTLSESMSLMEEYESLAAKIDKAQGEMTSAQVNRYLKITQKMTQAAYGL